MTVAEIVGAFPRLSVLVVGDICLDHWCTYDPAEAEPSRETGIPRLAVTSSISTPGAAGTVANNLVTLGAREVAVMGVVGDDGHGYELMRELSHRQIGTGLICRTPLIRTFTYTKIINGRNGEEDRPRIDFINTSPLPPSIEQELVGRVNNHAKHFDVVIISDQAETNTGGVVTPLLREALSQVARTQPGRVFWADSRRRLEHFRHITLKPNEDEVRGAFERAALSSFSELRAHTRAPALIVTSGGTGAKVTTADGEWHVPTRPVAQPVDICGAGDSFNAGGALTLAITGDPLQAAYVGNLVASITIMQKGTGSATPQQVIAAAQEVPGPVC